MSASRLDMGHGFIRFITRNQIDRDNYDKREKARVAQSKQVKQVKQVKHSTTAHSSTGSSKAKKPDIQTYVPPTKQHYHQNATSEVSTNQDETQMKADLMFRLEYEDQEGDIHDLFVHMNDDPNLLAKRFGRDLGFTQSMQRAFTDFLREQIRKHSKS